ncbi:MAG: hypothetical protein D6728_19510 [Cyanobacteria bacterium J055]|nr:MAG: hypothetical protein D6728_19510 [Cyanobacteria bacterium J055]
MGLLLSGAIETQSQNDDLQRSGFAEFDLANAPQIEKQGDKPLSGRVSVLRRIFELLPSALCLLPYVDR